jgi:hypothetical protein
MQAWLVNVQSLNLFLRADKCKTCIGPINDFDWATIASACMERREYPLTVNVYYLKREIMI